MSDYYSILGVKKGSTVEDIKKAYKKKVLQYHPDRVEADKKEAANKEFQKIQEAYDVLSDEKKRHLYDSLGHDGYANQGQGFSGFEFDPSSFDGFENIFTSFFGGGFEQASRTRAKKGEDLRYTMQITLEEAFEGIKTKIKLRKMLSCKSCYGSGVDTKVSASTCSYCNGTGRIKMRKLFLNIDQICSYCMGSGKYQQKCGACSGECRSSSDVEMDLNIPRGCMNEMTLRFPNEGNAGLNGGANGDLLLTIYIQKHKLFEVDGINLKQKISISVFEAVLGAKIMVSTISHEEVMLNIPAGTQPLAILKVAGQGFYGFKDGKRGDMYIILEVKLPEKLSSEEKNLWQSLSDLKNA